MDNPSDDPEPRRGKAFMVRKSILLLYDLQDPDVAAEVAAEFGWNGLCSSDGRRAIVSGRPFFHQEELTLGNECSVLFAIIKRKREEDGFVRVANAKLDLDDEEARAQFESFLVRCQPDAVIINGAGDSLAGL